MTSLCHHAMASMIWNFVSPGVTFCYATILFFVVLVGFNCRFVGKEEKVEAALKDERLCYFKISSTGMLVCLH